MLLGQPCFLRSSDRQSALINEPQHRCLETVLVTSDNVAFVTRVDAPRLGLEELAFEVALAEERATSAQSHSGDFLCKKFEAVE
jgi:hypothetical protein